MKKQQRKEKEMLEQMGKNLDFIVTQTGTKKYYRRIDKKGNRLCVGPTGRMLIFGHDGKVYTAQNLFSIKWFDGTKPYQVSVEKLLKAEKESFVFDIDHPNIKNLEDMFRNPKVEISDYTTKAYSEIMWEPYLGREVEVIYKKGKKRITVKQKVSSLDELAKEKQNLSDAIRSFLDVGRKTNGQTFERYEHGIWCLQGKQRLYRSEPFTSKAISHIAGEDALPALKNLLEETIPYENEEDLNKLTLVHTHPVAGVPLSKADVDTIERLAIGLKGQNDTMEVMAIPLHDKKEIIFRYAVK